MTWSFKRLLPIFTSNFDDMKTLVSKIFDLLKIYVKLFSFTKLEHCLPVALNEFVFLSLYMIFYAIIARCFHTSTLFIRIFYDQQQCTSVAAER